MAGVRVYLFGIFRAEREHRPLEGLDATKAQELLAYLLVRREHVHPRETLAERLFGESRGSGQPRKQLRQALWQLQTALGEREPALCPRLLRVETETIGIDPSAQLWCDALAFQDACTLARDIPGRQLDAPAAEALRDAAQLYRGDLLEGCYQDWCLQAREELQNLYLLLLDKLVDYGVAHQHYESGLLYATRLLDREPAHERTHRRLMRLYALAGDRTAALRQYQRCVQVLQAELGVAPAASTVALYERLRADRFPGSPPAAGAARAPLPSDDHAARLRGLRALLAQMQREVQRDLDAIDLALKSWR